MHFRRGIGLKKALVIAVAGFVLLGSLAMHFLRVGGVPIWRRVFGVCGVADFSTSADGYPMAVHVLDMGKADCTFITCEGHNIMIDAGETDIYNVPCEYLRKLGVRTLDLLMLTHPHSDHVGCMSSVVDGVDVREFVMPHIKDEMVPTFASYERLLLALDKKGVCSQWAVPSKSYDFGSMNLQILGPVAQYDDMNSNSIVCKVTYGNRSFIFTGDAGEESERDLIAAGCNLNADVLKVGHHGSATATSQAFLSAVQPEIAVIPVGQDRNNLPKRVTVDRLASNRIKTYRTDLDGTVIVATDGDNIEVFCEKD